MQQQRSSAGGREAEAQELLQLPAAGDGVCQAAFSSRTPGGGTVILFFTGILTPLVEAGAAASSSSSSSSAPSPVPCQWQVSLQLRCDDARVRAVLAADVQELLHSVFGGRLSLLAQGHSPSPASLLQRLEMVSPPHWHAHAPQGNTARRQQAALLPVQAAPPASAVELQQAQAQAQAQAQGAAPAFSALLLPPGRLSLEELRQLQAAASAGLGEQEELEEEQREEAIFSLGSAWSSASYAAGLKGSARS